MIKVEGKERTAKAFRDAETANLRVSMKLGGGQVGFFEEMVEVAHHSGVLWPNRLAPSAGLAVSALMQLKTEPNPVSGIGLDAAENGARPLFCKDQQGKK